MKLENRTDYRNDHLRAILTRVAREELDPADRKKLYVRIVYARTGVSGFAYYGDVWLKGATN